jgi:hypothetical protein
MEEHYHQIEPPEQEEKVQPAADTLGLAIDLQAFPPDGTSTLLVQHLREKPQTPGRDALIARVLAMEFHDFKSPHATPKILLNTELHNLGYHDLSQRLRNGDYD